MLPALVGVVVVAAVLYMTCSRSMDQVDQSVRTEAVPVTERAASARAPRLRAKPATEGVAEPASPAPDLRAPDVPRPAPGTTTTRIELFGRPAVLAAPKHTLRGRVVDSAGDPVPNVRVSLSSSWLPPDLCEEALLGWVTSNAVTGADGAFATASSCSNGVFRRCARARRGTWATWFCRRSRSGAAAREYAAASRPGSQRSRVFTISMYRRCRFASSRSL